MRRVHAEGERERRNHREGGADHDHDDPKPTERPDGRLSWCCPRAREIAREMGKFDLDGEYVGEVR